MRFHTLIGLLVIGVGFAPVAAAVAADVSAASFKITTKHPADKVTVELQSGVATFAIHCPGGIGRAVIERQAAKWPDKTTLRLYLRGLESFRISNGKSTLYVAVASHGEPRRIRVWKDDQENAPLTPNDSAWIAVRMLDKENRPTRDIPLADGTFELTLPGSLFADSTRLSIRRRAPVDHARLDRLLPELEFACDVDRRTRVVSAAAISYAP